MAVEFRHRNWLSEDQTAVTLQYFKRRSISLVSVDTPESEHVTTNPSSDVITNSQLAYLRLHVCNLRSVLSGKTVAERFDYRFSIAEQNNVADRVSFLSAKAAETRIVINNNSSDSALANA